MFNFESKDNSTAISQEFKKKLDDLCESGIKNRGLRYQSYIFALTLRGVRIQTF